MTSMIPAGHHGILLSWASEFDFEQFKNTLADLSSQHSNPPTSLSMIPFRSSGVPAGITYPTGIPDVSSLLDRVASVSLILSSDRNRGADVSELASLAADRHVNIEVFHPIDAHKAVIKFATRLAKASKGGCVSQEYKANELPVLLKAWIERQVAQSEGSAERIAQSYSGNHWMDTFGGFQ
ncbi:hypothetical protein [Streptomyces sp. NPDC050704]|uniref:hypothetical protein n=1 Tax=Streptomyces sp. NPDC050704 TaxID=3157219 RepID=UPI003442207A